MVLRLCVMAAAAVAILTFIWWRGRRLRAGQARASGRPGRDVFAEAASAFENVADQFLENGVDARKAAERAAGIDGLKRRD